MSRRRSRSLPGITLVAATALFLAACGAATDGPGSGIASIDDPTPASTGGATPSASVDPEAAWGAYQECMAEQGIDVPGEGEVAGGSIALETETEHENPQDEVQEHEDIDFEALEAAEKECARLLPDEGDELLNLSPEDQARLDDASLKFQQCMAEQGVEIEVPGGATDGGIDIHREQAEDDPQQAGNPDELDPEAVDAASQECDHVMEEVSDLLIPDSPGEDDQ